MKKITKTITSRVVVARMYSENTDELCTKQLVVCGDKFDGLERNKIKDFQILKVLEVGEPETKTYTMSIEQYMEKAHTSEFYMHGFINRKIGGEMAICKCYDLTNDCVTELYVENMKEKQLEKMLLDEYNCKLLVVTGIEKVDEKYYFMSEQEFRAFAE